MSFINKKELGATGKLSWSRSISLVQTIDIRSKNKNASVELYDADKAEVVGSVPSSPDIPKPASVASSQDVLNKDEVKGKKSKERKKLKYTRRKTIWTGGERGIEELLSKDKLVRVLPKIGNPGVSLTKSESQQKKEIAFRDRLTSVYPIANTIQDDDYISRWSLKETYEAKVWIKNCDNKGKTSCFNMEKETISVKSLKDREILLRGICWSVNSRYLKYQPDTGPVRFGEQLARVEASRHPDFHQKAIVLAAVGWRSVAKVNPDKVFVRKIPRPSPGLPLTLYLGTLGLPGLALYMGFMHLCAPQKNDIVMIAGNLFTAELVGKLALRQGCHVIFLANSRELARRLEKSNFNLVLSCSHLKGSDLLERIVRFQKIDIYFDTVGGVLTERLVHLLTPNTRGCVMGENVRYCTSLGQEGYSPDPYRFTSFCNLRPSFHHLFDFQEFFTNAERDITTLLNASQTPKAGIDTYNTRMHPEVFCPYTDFMCLPSALQSTPNYVKYSQVAMPQLQPSSCLPSHNFVEGSYWSVISQSYRDVSLQIT